MSVTKTKFPQWKTDTIDEISELIKSNNTTAFCNLHKVRATQLMQLRKSFKDDLKRSEEHTSELQSLVNLVCRLLLEKKKNNIQI